MLLEIQFYFDDTKCHEGLYLIILHSLDRRLSKTDPPKFTELTWLPDCSGSSGLNNSAIIADMEDLSVELSLLEAINCLATVLVKFITTSACFLENKQCNSILWLLGKNSSKPQL